MGFDHRREHLVKGEIEDDAPRLQPKELEPRRISTWRRRPALTQHGKEMEVRAWVECGHAEEGVDRGLAWVGTTWRGGVGVQCRHNAGAEEAGGGWRGAAAQSRDRGGALWGGSSTVEAVARGPVGGSLLWADLRA
jgi:hypothetical protein